MAIPARGVLRWPHTHTISDITDYSGGGGGGAWGSITGTLSDQTDLQSALGAKADASTTYTKTEVDTLLAAMYPVGAVVMLDSSSSPSALGLPGTWAVWSTGRVPVSLDAGDVDFDTLGETGGSK